MNLRRRGLLLSSIMLPILLLVMCIHWGEGYRIHNKKVRSGLTDYMVHSDLRLPANHYQSWARQSRHSMTYEAQRMDIKGINAVVFKSPSHRPRSQLFGSQRKGNATYSRRSKLRARVAFMVDRVRRFLAKMKYFLSCLWQYIMALREFFRPLNQTEWREFIQPPQKQNFEKYRVSILDSEGDLYDLVSNNEEDSPIEVGFRQLDKKGRDRLYVETRLKEIDDLMKNAQQKAAKKVVNKKRDRLYIESRLKEIDAMLNRTETAAEDKDAVAAPESTPVSATNANSTAATTPSSAHAERAYSSQEESTQVYWPPGIKTRITMEQTREYGPLSYSIPLATPATGNTSSVDAAGQSNNRTFVGDRFPTFEWSAPYSTNWMQRNEDGDELLKLDFFEGKWRLSEKRQNDSKPLAEKEFDMFDEIEIPRYGPVQCKLNGSSGLEWKYVTPTMHTDDSLSSTASSGIFEMKVLRGCSSTRWNRAAGGSLTAEVVRPPRALHFDQMPTTVIYRGAVDGSKIIGDVYIVRPLSQIAGGVSAGNTSSSSNTTSVLPLPANAVVGVESQFICDFHPDDYCYICDGISFFDGKEVKHYSEEKHSSPQEVCNVMIFENENKRWIHSNWVVVKLDNGEN